MQSASMKRSQAILRMPVDMVDAVMILQSGERSDVLLFIPPSEDVARFVSEGGAFLPVVRDANTHLVARAALAALGVPARLGPKLDDDLPTERQQVRVVLRGGISLEGELAWVAPPGQQRLADHLNTEAPGFALYAGDTTYFVMKTGVVMVTEL
jgi:hypothetical protein